MHGGLGTLHYSINHKLSPPYKCILSIDQSINDFYYALIPKSKRAKRQAFPSHISVVRKETPTDLTTWGKYENHTCVFDYEPIIRNDDNYFWLDCFSVALEHLRTELGLENKTYIRPMPENSPFKKRFHTTIGNIKTA